MRIKLNAEYGVALVDAASALGVSPTQALHRLLEESETFTTNKGTSDASEGTHHEQNSISRKV